MIEHCIQENDFIHLFFDAKTSTPKKDDTKKVAKEKDLSLETKKGNSEANAEDSEDKIKNSETQILNPEEKIESVIDNN